MFYKNRIVQVDCEDLQKTASKACMLRKDRKCSKREDNELFSNVKGEST